jgi:mannosidase alpha-like ER degradation enhancer 2
MIRPILVSIVVATSLLLEAQGSPPIDRAALARRTRAEFLHSWNGYKRFAWGHDELLPVSRKARDWHQGAPLLMTPLDALDTMLIMGLRDEARTTREYIARHLSFDRDVSVQNFEITIRTLGGLISAYEMTGDARLLALADDLGTRLLPVFDSPTGLPYRFVNLKTGETDGAVSNPAEIGTLIVEFGTLSKLTKKPAFWDKPRRALAELYKRRDPDTGLVGEEINVNTGEWVNRSSHIGGAIDSYYEYLLKCEVLFADRECGDMWRTSLAAINRYLADDRSNGLWYGVADMHTGRRTATTYGSLHAFFPAVLALGGDVDRARRLQASGFTMWKLHGIEPEELDYSTMTVTHAGYQLRPEIVESAYYLSHYTRDPRYLEMGRELLDSLQKYCRTPSGYTVLRSVVTKEKGDRMHSFWLAETLKYLYLLFEPEAIDFERVVFNTEAHPVRREPATR